MRSFWSDPYLWIHLAGVASVPLWLELCLLALAVGDPILPVWLELLLVGTVGIAPILWMQWQRPFDIYSLLFVSLKPDRLTEAQRKLLTLFTMQRNQYLAVGVAIGLAVVLQKLYVLAPIAAAITPFAASGRLVGLLIAAIAFLGANLFLQVPVAVLSVLLSSEATYAATLPFATDQVGQRFLPLGFPVNQILPPLVVESPRSPAVATVKPASPAAVNPTVEPSISIATDATATNSDELSDDLDDIWGTEAEATPAELSSPAAEGTRTSDQVSTTPDNKPDFVAIEVNTEAVEPGVNDGGLPASGLMVAATETAATEATASSVDESWLDAPSLDDPASAEPPNSL